MEGATGQLSNTDIEYERKKENSSSDESDGGEE